jgi:hypothetical protein
LPSRTRGRLAVRLSLWNIVVAGVLCLVVYQGALAEESWDRWVEKAGPLQIVNQCPIQLLFLQPIPDRADTLPAGHGSFRVNTTLTNTLVSETSSRYDATLDMEHWRLAFDLAYGLSSRFEIGLNLPVAYYYSGFLDGFILEAEELLSSPRQIRHRQDKDQFTCFVKDRDGKTVIEASEDTVGLGDLTLRAKAKIWEQGEKYPALSVRGSVKFPTGSQRRAFGSGEFDGGLGLLLEKDMGQTSLYLNADATFTGDAYEDDISHDTFYTLMLGLEYRFSRRFSLVSQVYYISRPFEDTDVDVLSRRICDLLAGVHYRTEKNLFIQGGLVEDIISSDDATADVTFFFNVGKHF